MSKGIRTILVCFCVLAATTVVRADLSAKASAGDVYLRPSIASTASHIAVADQAPASQADHGLLGLGRMAMAEPNLGHILSATPDRSRPRVLLDTAGGPSSLSLLLSAMTSVGAWQLVRSSRKVHLGHVPEWFHTGTPGRIGRTRVVSLDQAGHLAVTCDGRDNLSSLTTGLSTRPATEPAARHTQHFLTVADTRGPPCPTC